MIKKMLLDFLLISGSAASCVHETSYTRINYQKRRDDEALVHTSRSTNDKSASLVVRSDQRAIELDNGEKKEEEGNQKRN